MGGMPAGPVEPSERDYADWEQRIDAMAWILFGIRTGKRYLSVDHHRRSCEALPPEVYDSGYYSRWVAGLAQCLIQRGLITSEELARKMTAAGMKQHHDMGGEAAGKVERDEHDYAQWERRVDAMAVLLNNPRDRLSIDLRRRTIEEMDPREHDATSYYERWVLGLGQALIQRGLITTGELARKMVEVERRG
jgi:hypothetical protein